MPAPREESNNLSYCTICKTVFESWWGFSYGHQETKHPDMPTIGLTRKDCKDCAKFRCPNCGDVLVEGECLAPHRSDESITCKVCDRCEEGFEDA